MRRVIWNIYAWPITLFLVTVTIVGLVHRFNLVWILDSAISFPSLVALHLHIWDKRFLSARYWKPYAFIFLIWDCFFVLLKPMLSGAPFSPLLLISLVILLPLYIGVFRYAFRNWDGDGLPIKSEQPPTTAHSDLGISCVSRRSGATPMIIPIKIQCGCGQHYAFDIETAGEIMPNTVACPVCGADGTAAANEAIAQSISAQPTVAAAPAGRTRIRVMVPPPSIPPATGPRGAVQRAGQIDPAQAQHEARAKILWGDPPEAVIGYLLIQGFSREEASDLVNELFRERATTVRTNEIKKY